MAIIRKVVIRTLSGALGTHTSITVLYPSSTRARPPGVLYLLHGYSDDDSVWTRLSALERHLGDRNLAIVMPQGGLSFYTDMQQGQAWYRHVAEEVPALVEGMFRVSTARRDTFIAGQSMGGYGAFKIALLNPAKFCAAASLSGALDISARVFTGPGPFRDQLSRVFGDLANLKGSPHDLAVLLRRAIKAGVRLPRLHACCGAGDFLIEDNRRFAAAAARLGAGLDYLENDGAHDWAYWDREIPRVLDWLMPARK
jgi:S-formylglutathione hydrolase FrmB